MALRSEDGYAGPRALAEDLESWQAGEPVTAWREPWLDRSRRWAQRHRTLVTTSAAAVLIALVGLGGFSIVLSGKNRELAQQRDQQKAVTDYVVKSFRKPDPEQDGRTVAEVLRGGVKEPNDSKIDPSTRAPILHAVGQTYRGLGLFREAAQVYESAFRIRRKKLGADHMDALDSMNNLALCYLDQGQPDSAIPLLEHALKVLRSTKRADHPRTNDPMSNLAAAYSEAGRFDEARQLHEETLEARKPKLGEDHSDTLISMINVGLARFMRASSTEPSRWENAFAKRFGQSWATTILLR